MLGQGHICIMSNQVCTIISQGCQFINKNLIVHDAYTIFLEYTFIPQKMLFTFDFFKKKYVHDCTLLTCPFMSLKCHEHFPRHEIKRPLEALAKRNDSEIKELGTSRKGLFTEQPWDFVHRPQKTAVEHNKNVCKHLLLMWWR